MDAEQRGAAPGARDGDSGGGAERLRGGIDAFAAQLAAVRAGVAARAAARQAEAAGGNRDARLPAIRDERGEEDKREGRGEGDKGATRLRLPLLRRLEQARGEKAAPSDRFVAVGRLEDRAALQQRFAREAGEACAQELAAASAAQNANQLDEQARVAAVAFSKNERSWAFDERTRRYKDLLEARRQAEQARAIADEERAEGERRRALLNDPYQDLRASAVRSSPRLQLSPLEDGEFTWLWVLASPMLTLPFTPRQQTLGRIIRSEMELSTHVVYYIAAATYSDNTIMSPEEEPNPQEGRPPTDGWICCSSHGAFPAPTVTNLKSPIETWTVQGAGAGHVNGQYILSGTHDFARKFKSANGVELFRKKVAVVSELAQSLYDSPAATGTTSAAGDTEEIHQDYKPTFKTPESVLPSSLRSIEKDEHNFQSMQRIGAWLGMNEEHERYRKLQEAEHKANSENGHEATITDTSSVVKGHPRPIKITVQNDQRSRGESSADTVHARLDSCAPICKEWVLFLNCSKRDAERSGEMSKPKKTGLGCPYRHYYLSVEEKAGMVVWARGKESHLEKDVLSSIVEREARLAVVVKLSNECMTAYQQNLRRDTNAILLTMLNELNQIRLTTIRVIERIELWRNHVRSLGFSSIDGERGQGSATTPPTDSTTCFLLGWSVTITLSTGKQLYKGSKAFVSRIKRFCHPEDPNGMKEQHIIYLGYFKTRNEAERAYDEYAVTEARRLNTTATHLPRRRSVFRSCGKHYAVESERLGPSYCIECKAQALAASSAGDWTPPFYHTPGENYILKMAVDLDFLDAIPPLKSLLNDKRGRFDYEYFPLHGNTFLLPREPVYDPFVLPFTSFALPEVSNLADANEQNDREGDREGALSVERLVSAQKVLLQELNLYKPSDTHSTGYEGKPSPHSQPNISNKSIQQTQVSRIVETLYWDRCAALQVQQRRPPLAYRQPNVWCRPDAGEWSSLAARGANQLHFIFEMNLAAAGRELQKKRKELLKVMRTALASPLYFVHSRTVFTELITAGQMLKGDVIALEVKNMLKRLSTYDAWCACSVLVQRCFRGYIGRTHVRMRLKALRLSCALRAHYFTIIHDVAREFYSNDVVVAAVRRATKSICTPIYRSVIKRDGELVIVSIHSLSHSIESYRSKIAVNHSSTTYLKLSSMCCRSCARRFRVISSYGCEQRSFSVINRVCTCRVNGGGNHTSERWLIRAYNPVTSSIYRAEIGRKMLAQFLARYSGIHQLIKDVLQWRQEALISAVQMAYIEKRALHAHQSLLSWKHLSREAVQARKTASAQLENSVSLERYTELNHGAAIIAAEKAMNFSGRKFSEAQSWDPLENANDWRLIVEKRNLEKRLEEARKETEQCRVACFQAVFNEQCTRALVSLAQTNYDSVWSPLLEKYYFHMEAACIKEATSRFRFESVVHRLCHNFLCIRDQSIPIRRQLIIRRPLLIGSSALRVAVPEARRQRNCLRCHTLHLTNFEKGSLRFQQRRIVRVSVVSRDAFTEAKRKDGNIAWWVSAYEPSACYTQEVFLEWELVELLVGWKSPRLRRVQRSDRHQIANKLLAIAMLDRFTGEFTLQKLQFYQQMRLVRPRIYASKWFQDLRRGRKSGRGDEILRQGMSIGGRIGVVVVYENWGDLAFEFYHATSGRTYELTVHFRDMSEYICCKPLLLRLWISSVISNTYSTVLLKTLMKLLVFDSYDGTEVLCIKPLHMCVWAKCFQVARIIDTRRVLVSIREDALRDLRVDVFDVVRCHAYILYIEREALARIFRSNPTRSNCLQMLLRQNRKKMYEWMSSHITFQSLMEHPPALASPASILANGLHVRQSFQILNNWVRSRERIPAMCPDKCTIDRLADLSETSAFSSILFDQISLIPDCDTTLERNNLVCGTVEWESISAGATLYEVGKDFRHTKVDFYIQSHNLIVRLRKELFNEAEGRRQQVARMIMENEDWCSTLISTQEVLDVVHQGISQKIDQLTTALRLVDTAVSCWVRIHKELKKSAHCSELDKLSPCVNTETKSFSSSSQSRLIESVCTDLLASARLFYTLRSIVQPGVVVPLPDVARSLRICHDSLSERATESLYQLKLELNAIKTTQDISVKFAELHDLRHRALGFASDWLGVRSGRPEMSIAIQPLTDNKELVIGPTQNTPRSSEVLEVVDLHSCPPRISTALLIPEDPSQDIQEIFLDTAISFETATSHSVRVRSILQSVEPIFRVQLALIRREHSISPLDVLNCQRVLGGLLIYQVNSPSMNSRLRRNPRADTIIGHQTTAGLAILVPSLVKLGCDRPLWDQLVTKSKFYMKVVKEFDRATSEATTSLANEMRKISRSAKCLPWKIFASDRMRIARAFRRSQATEALDVASRSALSQERKDATIAITTVSFRHLEIMQEGVFSGLGALDRLRHIRFTVSKEQNAWKLTQANPKSLSVALNGKIASEQIVLENRTSCIDLDTIRIEVDSIDHPRRLLFSSRDLQSQRYYVVECGYYELLQHYNELTGVNKISTCPTTIQQWRDLAAFAAPYLTFRKKNGLQSMYLDWNSHHLFRSSEEVAPKAASEVCMNLSPRELVKGKSLTGNQRRCHVDTINRTCAKRFSLHERAVLQETILEKARHYRQQKCSLPSEWVMVMLEDQRSSALRGLLVLDSKVLARVQKAHIAGTRKFRKQQANGVGDGRAKHLQLIEICKELGVAVDTIDNITRHLEEIERQRTASHLQIVESTGNLWNIADVAEWWRRRLVSA